MTVYMRNRNCPCARCRTHGMMGPAVLITLGVIFLLKNYFYIPIPQTMPVLLLVIGAVLLVSRTGSTEGHIDPPLYAPGVQVQPQAVNPQPPAAAPQPWSTGVAAPPTGPSEPSDPQVKP